MIAYLGTFGIGLFGVAKVWAGYHRPPRANWWQTGNEVIGYFAGAMMICLATGLTVRWLHGRNPYRFAAAKIETATAALFLVSMLTGFLVMAFTGWATGTGRGFPGTIALLIWAFAAVVIVWHMKAIWGAMIVHSLWDINSTLGDSATVLGGWAPIIGELAFLALLLTMPCVLVAYFRGRSRTKAAHNLGT